MNLGYFGTLTGTVDAVIASRGWYSKPDVVVLNRPDCDCPASLVGYGLTSTHVASYSIGHE